MSEQFDLKKLGEPFDPKEIDWRIGQAGSKDNKPWAKVLAYIDARAVMDRLDAVVGPENWKERYWKEGAGWMCGLSIRVGGEWVEKVDGSEETDIEGFKGGISKALVRAGVKWGIGRYLYNLGDGWAQIVAAGTKAARFQNAKKDGKYDGQNYPAFNWLPPILPDWAIPKQEGQDAGKPQGNGGNAASVAAKSANTQQGIKDRLHGKQEAQQAGVPQAGAGQAQGATSGKGRTYEEEASAFFAEAGVPGANQTPTGRVQLPEGANTSGPGTGAGREVRPESGPRAPQAGVRGRTPGDGADLHQASAGARDSAPERPPADGTSKEATRSGDGSMANSRGASGGRDAGSAVLRSEGPSHPGNDGIQEVHAQVPSGSATQPAGQDGNRGGAQNGQARGERGGVSQGAREAAPQGSEGTPGEPKVKPVPKTAEEIAWFVEYMKTALKEVISMNQLADLWTTNVASVKVLPDSLKQEIIRAKDDCKARIQK